MMRTVRAWVWLFASFGLLGQCACTEHPNFEKPESGSSSSSIGNPLLPPREAPVLLSAICGTLARCNLEVTQSSCTAGVLASPGFSSALGIQGTSLSTYSDILNAEQASDVTANPATSTECISTVSALSCSSPEVSAAFSSASSTPYANASMVIPSGAGCSGMFYPIAYIQGNTVDTGAAPTSSASVAFNSAQTAGNMNVVAIMWYLGGTAVSSVVDTSGNNYSVAAPVTSNPTAGLYYAIYYAPITTGGSGNTVTVTLNSGSSSYIYVRIHEYSGLSGVLSHETGAGNSESLSTAAAAVSGVPALLFGGAYQSSGTATPGSGFTARNSLGGTLTEDKIVTASGNYGISESNSESIYWVMEMAVFH